MSVAKPGGIGEGDDPEKQRANKAKPNKPRFKKDIWNDEIVQNAKDSHDDGTGDNAEPSKTDLPLVIVLSVGLLCLWVDKPHCERVHIVVHRGSICLVARYLGVRTGQ